MRRLFWWQLSVLPLLAGMAAGAQVANSNQNGQSPGALPGDSAAPAHASEAPTPPTTTKQEVTVTAPRPERPLPPLLPDEFMDCMKEVGIGRMDPIQAVICDHRLNGEKHIVIEACINRDEKTAAPTVIQACTELLDRKILEGSERFYLFVNRANGYFAQGDKQHALDDYDAAVKVAPRSASPYYYRAVFYAAQSDDDAALRDFDTAIGLNSKLVPALRQRAKIYQARGNFSGALADYSEAIRLQPKTAALWSERGHVSLRQHDYESAVKDEARAIQLDPKLARAYYLRGAAFGDLGDSRSASIDIKTAVDLDPSLARYVTIKSKTASLALPPL